MAVTDRRIAWLLTAEAFECGSAAIKAGLSVASEAGFRVVAMNYSMANGEISPEIEAEAMRLGMQSILVNDAAHCRLGSGLRDAERWSLAQALSRDGFDGFILCEVCDSRTRAESLLATARVLLRNLDQLDWESYHQDRTESFVEREVGAQAKPVAHVVALTPISGGPRRRSVRRA